MFVTTGGDSMVKVWDLATLRQIHGIKAPANTVGGILANPAGAARWLVTTDDTVIDVWNAAAASATAAELGKIVRCRLPYRLEGQVIVPTATPDGC
jgi:WD40 repeat protein